METSTALQQALKAAARSADWAGVDVRALTETSDLADVEVLLAAVWQHPPGSVELDITLLVALARSGHYVVGAFRDGRTAGRGDCRLPF